MKELGLRKLDETPAALANAAGTLAADLAKQTETIRLWAETAGVTLPKVYEDGVLAWQQILDERQVDARELDRVDPLELLLDAPAQLEAEVEVFAELVLAALAVGVEQLDQARDGAQGSLAVALADVVAEREVLVGEVGEVEATQLVVEDLRDVVGDEAEVTREVLGAQLRHLPPRQVGVPAIVEGGVVADGLRQRREQVGRPGDRLDVAVDVAVEDDAGVGADRALVVAAGEGALLHVPLEHLLLGLVLEVRAGDLVEGDEVVADDEAGLVLAVFPAEKVGDGALAAGEQDRVGRQLAEHERLAGLARAELDQVVVLLDHRHQAQQVEQLAAPGEVGMRRLVAHRPQQDVDPLFAGEGRARGQELVEPRAGDLDRLHAAQDERPRDGAVDEGVVVGDLDVRPHAAGEDALVLVHDLFADVHLRQAGGRQGGPVLAALVLLVEGHGDEVDQLHRPTALEAGLDQLGLVGPHHALGDRLLDHVEARADLSLVGRRAVLAQQVLEDVDGDVEADLEGVDEVLADDAAREGRHELLVERVDPGALGGVGVWISPSHC